VVSELVLGFFFNCESVDVISFGKEAPAEEEEEEDAFDVDLDVVVVAT